MQKTLTRKAIAATCFFFFCMPLYLFAEETSAAKENKALFHLKKVKNGDTLWRMFGARWKTVAKINRISPELIKEGMTLKVPFDWKMAERNAPVPRTFPIFEKKLIFVDLVKQTFGAYKNGSLIKWGPVSSSAKRAECGLAHEKKRTCVTPTGNFHVLEKDRDHVSSRYPPPHGGALMEYAIRFHGNYWIHAGELPGYPDSYGCIRVLDDDAQWLFAWANKKTAVIII